VVEESLLNSNTETLNLKGEDDDFQKSGNIF